MSKDSQQIKCPKCGEVFGLDGAAYADIRDQVRGVELEREVHERLEQLEKTAAAQRERDVTEAKAAVEKVAAQKESKLIAEIEKLKGELSQAGTAQELAVTKATQNAKAREAELAAELANAEGNTKLAVLEVEAEFNKKIQAKEFELGAAKSAYEELVKFRRELSTQGIGQEFEDWCEEQFRSVQDMAFPNSTFIKDTTVKDGSKGDFIFRDFIDGLEFISIMFEMKNEAHENVKGKKNKDFFEKLDKDRVKKNCEYAILVSTLEPESDLYNRGIHIVHGYEKMLVIRPVFFIQMIGMLRSFAATSVQEKKQLQEMRAQNIDITNFQSQLADFKDSFGTTSKNFHKNMEKALTAIDESIAELEKTKGFIKTALGHMDAAGNKVDKVSIKSLTKGNPTMEAKFKELGQA